MGVAYWKRGSRPWNPTCGHLGPKETSQPRSSGGPWTEPSAAPPRNPTVPLQRGDSDTEERRRVPGPSAAVRAALVPLPGWGIPVAAGDLGVGTQAPPSWEAGSSPQINCSKYDTGVIHV